MKFVDLDVLVCGVGIGDRTGTKEQRLSPSIEERNIRREREGRGLESFHRLQAYGGYFTLGRVFAKMIGNPTFMKQATKYGLPRTSLMRFTLKLMANLRDPYDGDVSDRVINALAKVAPAA